MRHLLFIGIVVLSFTPLAPAEDVPWAQKMFDKTSHDFGVVARGAEVKHTFTIENIWEEDVHIASVRTSCHCTTPKPSKYWLKTWEKAELTVEINTRAEPGRKDATITVKFDQPFPAEVQLHTHTYIRKDVVVQPGVVQFDSVDAGSGWQQSATVSYAGRNDWKILRVESPNPLLEGAVKEKYRTNDQVAQVGYDLIVTLKPSAPPGYLHEEIYLVTNDSNPQAARVPVAVEGLVTSPIMVHPNPLSFGTVAAGQRAPHNLIIQSKTPFRILSVLVSDAQRLRCKIPQEAKAVHLLPITLVAPSEEGKFLGKIRIQTDQGQVGPLDVDVIAQITPQR